MTFLWHWLRRHRTDYWTSEQGVRRDEAIVLATVYSARCYTCNLDWRCEVE